MKKEMRIALTFLASFALVAAFWAITPATSSAQATARAQTPAAQSVSGKITSIEKSSFTLAIAAEHTATTAEHLQSDSPAKTMTFQVDQNTTIDGKLKIGANADVTYRQEGGNNIAISVRVAS